MVTARWLHHSSSAGGFLPRGRRLCGLGLAGLLLATIAAAQGIVQPSDKSPDKDHNPCTERKGRGKVVSDDVWKDFKTILAEVLSQNAGVIADIDAQVKGKVPDDQEKPVAVEIFVVDLAEFKKEYTDDVDSKHPEKTPQQLQEEAEGLFNRATAYTYISDKKNPSGTDIIKIKVFCKQALSDETIDKKMYETLVHELVHAKIYTFRALGQPDPFPDHDDNPDNDDQDKDHKGDKDFYDEVKRLLKKLKENLKLGYLPKGQFGADALATGAVLQGDTQVPVVLSGRAGAVMGPASDSQPNGLLEVACELVPLSLQSTNPIPIQLEKDESQPSPGAVEEQTPGVPFPADSFFDVFYVVTLDGQRLPGSAHLTAVVDLWPPFGETYSAAHTTTSRTSVRLAQPIPPPNFVLESLTLLDPDTDGDGVADSEDPDDDDDGLPDADDPGPLNPDRDADGVSDLLDNCPDLANPDQSDTTAGGVGDACQVLELDAAIPALQPAGLLALIFLLGLAAFAVLRRSVT